MEGERNEKRKGGKGKRRENTEGRGKEERMGGKGGKSREV